jgi:molybdate transport system substrate-binding protein
MTTDSRNSPRPAGKRIGVVALVGAVALVVAACTSSAATAPTPTAPLLTGTITVSAASSLSKVFPALAARFEAIHPGTAVMFNFGSSSALAIQIVQGAPADVFASAAAAPMATVQAAGNLAGPPTTFARNSLEIVVKLGNPLGIKGLFDLPRAHVVALCVATAPCGAAAAEALARARVDLHLTAITRAPDVDSTLAQTTIGDADAAIVYVTNAATVGSAAVGVPIPPAQNVSTSYPIAVLRSTSDPALAKAWAAYVLGPVGNAALLRAHFQPPR